MTYAVTRFVYRPLSLPLARLLARTPVTPLQVTIVSALITVGAAALFATDAYLAAGLLTFVAEVTDCIDGDLARLTQRSSKLGAFVDSVLDRWMDALLIGAIAYSDPEHLWLPASFALVGSFLTSYTRARAQGLGTDCPGGIGGRDVRALLIVLGGVTGWLAWALVAIAIVSFATALQRAIVTGLALRDEERPGPTHQ